ncbi:single-stranded-DNA-specific exonuclease RecJ [Oceanibacterium hippocampi]|uniref:Single-stranded-DNA-specific exonuclease RecJ n=1 Tax=Oceanibacterium hippocampi TaxID=745714 RepID=A0A1Y5SUU2_9PROT|nr:single-stranded-DNA-specific exonuclease RecJ [Oceanibacterium hippocampi]SLN45519.1 Single-stranded-DNA-specific exonuclease RecJ [Oceanibacterium hippocampi]
MAPPVEVSSAPAFLGVEQSLTGRRWRSRLADDRLGMAIAQAIDVPEVIGRVLAGRGVDRDDASDYLDPTLKGLLPDPARFHDMEAAAARLAAAVVKGETIAIFGDYDVDGATSSALLWRYLDAVGARPLVHIPDRLREGYGPNAPAMLSLAGKGARIVVTVDCGTVAHAPLEAAAEAGLEVIVVDHHLAEPALPRALAVINPNRLDEEPGYGQLAAVGVAFMLVVALNRALRAAGHFGAARAEPNLLQWLDLVALGTVCDVVPLTGINRALVRQGLKVMARRNNCGIAALADVAGLSEAPGTYHVGFLIGPRVNAGGRVGRSSLGVEILTTEDPMEAAALARELDRLNGERRDIEAGIESAAIGMVEAAGDDPGPIAIAAGEGWHPGVIGIVASRLKDRFRRPALVIALDGEVGRGSGRSVPGVDLGAAVTAARQAGLLVNGGGHAMAAGLTVARDRVPALREFLAERLSAQVGEARQAASLGFDGALRCGGATVDFIDLLAQAGPFGAGNPEPRFALPDVTIVRADIVGERHVRCVLAGADGGRLAGIAFRSIDGPLGPALLGSKGRRLHLAGHLRADTWRGERRLQFTIEDAAFAAG